MNRPLTKEEREIVRQTLSVVARLNDEQPKCGANGIAANAIKQLLTAEAYWREAVKAAHEPREDCICVFCSCDCLSHLTGCPWKLANND